MKNMKIVVKKILLYLVFLAVFTFTFINKNIKVYAFNNDLEKIYCDAVLTDDFSDDEILIIINKQLSILKKFKV